MGTAVGEGVGLTWTLVWPPAAVGSAVGEGVGLTLALV